MTAATEFIHETSYDDLPAEVKTQALHCLLDLCGSVVAGRHTTLSAIIREHATLAFGGDQASLLMDGRRVSAPGAAMANGMLIDAIDIHDGHLPSLGHAGAIVFPALLAIAEYRAALGGELPDGREFLTALTIGYDLGTRAGPALHGTVPDYHTSGAWGAIAAAALYARLFGLGTEQTRHAMGIAEYHGLRSQMMRCIDHPTMVNDGSGWGAMVGVSAGMLAEGGFTGAPAVTVEREDAAPWWETLGAEWKIMEQRFKTHGVCLWAQPAIEAALALTREHRVAPDAIRDVEVETFEKATRLNHPLPETTEQAQYSLPFPVAAALWKGLTKPDDPYYGLGPDDLLDDSLSNPQVQALSSKVRLVEADDLQARFPALFLARVRLTLNDGRVVESPVTTFRGDLDAPIGEAELRQKYRWLASGLLSDERVDAIEDAVFAMPEAGSIAPLLGLLSAPPDREKA